MRRCRTQSKIQELVGPSESEPLVQGVRPDAGVDDEVPEASRLRLSDHRLDETCSDAVVSRLGNDIHALQVARQALDSVGARNPGEDGKPGHADTVSIQ